MRIDPVRGATSAAGSRRAGPAGGEGFALPVEGAKAAAGAAPVAATAAVDALLALQMDEPGRRQRQVKRGAHSLDALDRLQAALLSGADEGPALAALRDQLASRERTGEPGLDEALNDIDVRAAVELAKRARGRGAGRA